MGLDQGTRRGAVGAAALLVASSLCSGSVKARHREAAAQGGARKVDRG